MYINKIDELIAKIIDDFYNNVILKNKEFSKITSEVNFVKYQSQINKIMIDYRESINDKEISSILNNENNVLTVIEMIKRYLAYYLFLTIGFHYTGKRETFINNIIEFTKNQPSFNYKIANFFNSYSNSNLIKFFTMEKNIVQLLEADRSLMVILAKKPEFADTVTFLNERGLEFINSNFKLENLSGNVKDQGHNIIKTIIFIEMYIKEEKKDVYMILESGEEEKGEYIFIDIVVPKTDFIDFSAIENVLTIAEIENGMAYEIYDMLTKFDEVEKAEKTPEDKILILINNNLLVPIVDDFMLYHKDSEKYEKITHAQIKKKEDTKLRYIVSKIDSVTEYYSENAKKDPEAKKNIEKHFYMPLGDRNAVLINNIEELRIIQKLHNQGRATIENNEYYNDLMNYRIYPYINFKDFANYGITVNMTKTVDAIRYCTFEKQLVKGGGNKNVQMRIGSQGHTLNIVGFAVPTNLISTYCLRASDVYDIRKIGYGNGTDSEKKKKLFANGYDGTLKFLKYTTLASKKFKQSVYWIFDPNVDKVRLLKYEQSNKINDIEYLKLIISNIYDDILRVMYNKILKKVTGMKEVTFFEFNRILTYYAKKMMEIPTDSTYFHNLNNIIIYEKHPKAEMEYDKKEDSFPGLYGDVIKLPTPEKKGKEGVPTIKLNLEKYALEKITKRIKKEVTPKYIQEVSESIESDIESSENKLIAEKVFDMDIHDAICQHNISWENISAIRKKNPNKFNEMLIEFIYQYIMQNNEDDFICKSCGGLINLRKYVIDGAFDDEGRYTTFSTPMQIPIEDIPEYEKYKPTIRNIDKIIERLASISNMHFLLEKSARQKNPIKLRIIKDSIDIVLLHNKNLQPIYKERTEKINARYGVNKELSNLFIFELDNNIFVYSSKDKDYYKPIKRNNIITYIVILIILELTDTQIIYMGGDKICNFYTFSKVGYRLFDDLKIIKNNENTTVPIQKYKTLCFVVFYISCLITKYGMWYHEEISTDKEIKAPEASRDKKKFNPLVQKMIIHTIIDTMNSILEIYSGKKKKHYLYNIIATKLFQKMNSTFQNDNILQKLKEIHERKIVTEGTVKKYVTIKVKPVELAKHYAPGDYSGITIWDMCKIAKAYMSLKNRVLEKLYNISNITNCEDGHFHQWVTKGKSMECKHCNLMLNSIKHNSSLTDPIIKNYKFLQIKKYAERYCESGQLHDFIYDTKKECNVCNKCKYTETNKLSNTELSELEKNIIAMKENQSKITNKEEDKMLAKDKERAERYKTIITNLKSQYGRSKTHKEDFYNHIKGFIDNIEHTIGKDININNENIFVKYDVYIINHDHNGYSLDKPIIISEKENKIQYKKAHPFFKKDVLFYTNYQLHMDVFYDSTTLLLLGYKERNKDFQVSKKRDVYMKINYSVTNRLRMLGYTSLHVDVASYTKKYSEDKMDQTLEQRIIREIISDMSRRRIVNLKKSIIDIQRYIYRIKYEFPEERQFFQKDMVNLDDFMNKYKKKLKKLQLRDDKGENKVFSDWRAIKYDMFFQDLSDKVINLSLESEYLTIDDINYYDYHGNIILFYIVNELDKIIRYNDDKFIRVTVIYLLIDIINRLYNMFNEEQMYTDFDVKRFSYKLQSQSFMYDVEQKGHGLETEYTEGFYGEYKDPDDAEDVEKLEGNEEAQEELDALDVDTEIDYEIDYMPGVNTE